MSTDLDLDPDLDAGGLHRRNKMYVCLCHFRPSCFAGTAATTGLTVPRLLDLLTQSLGLVAVPTSVLCASLYYIATTLDVDMESVLQLAIQQPTLLCAQVKQGSHLTHSWDIPLNLVAMW